jgi:sugar lactone lactonase YvrE
MSSGFIQLAALGQQDVYLTGTPAVTYFASVYKRHTPFVLEAFEVPFEGSGITMGQNNIVRIPVKGDLVRATTLKLTLPPLAEYAEDWFWPIQPSYPSNIPVLNDRYYATLPVGQQYFSSNTTSFNEWSASIPNVYYDPNLNKFIFLTDQPYIYFYISNSTNYTNSGVFWGFDPKNPSLQDDTYQYYIATDGVVVPDFTLEQAGWARTIGAPINTLSSMVLTTTSQFETGYIDFNSKSLVWTNEDIPAVYTITPGGRIKFTRPYATYIVRSNFTGINIGSDTSDGPPSFTKFINSTYPLNIFTPDLTQNFYFYFTANNNQSNTYIYIEPVDAFVDGKINGVAPTPINNGPFLIFSNSKLTTSGSMTAGNDRTTFSFGNVGQYLVGINLIPITPAGYITNISLYNSSRHKIEYSWGNISNGEIFLPVTVSNVSNVYEFYVYGGGYVDMAISTVNFTYLGLPNGGTELYPRPGFILPFNGILERSTITQLNFPINFSTNFTSNGVQNFITFGQDVVFSNVGTYECFNHLEFNNDTSDTILTFSNAQYDYYTTNNNLIRIDNAPFTMSVTAGTKNMPSPYRNVSTISITGGDIPEYFYNLINDSMGNIYTTDTIGVYKIAVSTMVSTGIASGFSFATGLCIESNGTIYVADQAAHQIKRIHAGTVTVFAGTGNPGFVDGPGSVAQFNSPTELCVDSNGNVYVTDTNNSAVRKITPSGVVSTLAGPVQAGIPDMTATNSITRGSNGTLYVSDYIGVIWSINPVTGFRSLIAGQPNHESGYIDGLGRNSLFQITPELSIDAYDNLYVCDNYNCLIRKITKQGNLVFTIAGVPSVPGTNNPADGFGPGALFNLPITLTVLPSGEIYVGDVDPYTQQGLLRKLDNPPANFQLSSNAFMLFTPLTTSALPTDYSQYHYYDSVGTWAIKSADLKIGGQTIETLTGEAIEIWNDLNVPYENQPGLKLLTGKYDTTIASGREYYVNLPFYFYGKSGSYLPISVINRQDVEIWITFRTLQELTAIKTAPNPVGASLIIEYVYLAQPEVNWLSKTNLDYIIEQYQYHEIDLAQAFTQGNFELIFENPVNTLLFVIQIDGSLPYDWSNDGLANLGITINGEELVTNRITDGTQLGIIEPFNNFINFPTRNFYIKTFKSPINFSRLRQVILELNIFRTDGYYPSKKLRVIAVNRNVMRVADGLAGLMFISQ